ncbi:hypothetical protein DL89DRAFT_265847 [Linderina pennispora]|uniref:Uncharacterized protein n=1 Tax=Linderina pennispora TaxID=61395 RepID=A0A1Y1WFB3_9FUNG|nr:uncharacterized protein DL89DRAFT_265847 [Linderina pennispora]ORX72240.1 hypothetical protein DL89DRAFT_265847 [Linderina pennispora]
MSGFGHLDKRTLVRVFAIYLNSIGDLQKNGILRYYVTVYLSRSLLGNAIYIFCYCPWPNLPYRFMKTSSTSRLLRKGKYFQYSLSDVKLWRTNIPYIVNAGLYSKVDRVYIWAMGCSISLSFGKGAWHSVSDLHIIETPPPQPSSASIQSEASDMDTLTNDTFTYITQHLQSISSLAYDSTSANLVLPSFEPYSFSHTSFAPYLSALYMNLQGRSLSSLPKVFAPSLVKLTIFSLELDFTWDIFQGALPRMVIFENLTQLKVYFKKSTKLPVQPAYNGNTEVGFPKLRALHFVNHPYTSTCLSSIFKDSPVDELVISFFFEKLDAFDAPLLLNKPRITLWVSTYTGTAEENSFVRNQSTTRYAEVVIPTSLPVRLPMYPRWTKLEKLFLRFPVYLSELVRILPQLPLLRWLVVGAIYRSAPDSLSSMPGSHIWSTSIRVLCLFSSITAVPTIPDFGSMCILVSGLPSLQRLLVPDGMLSDVRARLAKQGLARYMDKSASKLHKLVRQLRTDLAHLLLMRDSKMVTENGYYRYPKRTNSELNITQRLMWKLYTQPFKRRRALIPTIRRCQRSLFIDTKEGGHGVVEFDPSKAMSFLDEFPVLEYSVDFVPVSATLFWLARHQQVWQ